MSDVPIVVRTPAGSQERVVTTGTTAGELFEGDRSVVVAKVNDVLRDLAHALRDGDVVEPVAVDQRRRPRRAAALDRARAGAGGAGALPRHPLGIGPPIENGFYYDFDARAAVHARGPRRPSRRR